jgi:hypothetical protein
MSSKVITATNIPAVGSGSPPGALVVSQVKTKDNVPTSITIDNTNGSGAHQFVLYDSFTPDMSNSLPTPQFTSVPRFTMDISAGDVETWDEDDLKGVKCIGAMSLFGTDANEPDTGCIITVAYETDRHERRNG